MNGTCKCGGVIKERNHQVTTERGILEYEVNCALPANIETSECGSCGRNRLVITDAMGHFVYQRG